MEPAISVIVCTHNPKRDYLDKVLAALKSQTLFYERWELLLIDNAGEKILSSEIDLSWHPNARHVREDQLGLTPARLRGIREAQAEILVFVDDDNVLDSDYLEVTLQISKDFPFLGAWGGQIKGEFEKTPPDWAKPYLPLLAIREFEVDKWSNLLHQHETTPCGAGMCLRKVVAQKYADLLKHDSVRLGLDRKGVARQGEILLSCGDSDLAFTSCDIGLGTGQFTALKLIHLMPASRLTEEYLIRLVEGGAYSLLILDSFRGKTPTPPITSWQQKILAYLKSWKMNPKDRRFYQARKRGEALAIQEILKFNKSAIA
ncbi:glycosyltransferase [Plectonema radiosum NIES-515]|uniref:Glycosyltransferase n=1 Tax=Plectonema radiosum NIES-515 TaxID=2986073 RepID=A0ABT3B1J9_9CYAN|nr:glycosyltransferase [Plectonema radiosum]MCV3215248.1 glycosyltransferase [Plectonema radiosum NIES-515]